MSAVEASSSSRRRERDAKLPFVVNMGPYRLAIEFRDKGALYDKRRLACLNLEDQRIELRSDLEGIKLATVFFQCIVRLCHASKGCQQGCIEEAYAHSFATGMVEFAQRNQAAWSWFNLLLTRHIGGDVRYDSVVHGTVSPPCMPNRVFVGGLPVRLRSISRAQTGRAFGWYDFSKQEAQLYDGLTGSNLAVVALHELTHAVHHRYDIKSRDTHGNFRSAQAKGWLSIMTKDPIAWRWLAWVMTFPVDASLQPPGSSRAGA